MRRAGLHAALGLMLATSAGAAVAASAGASVARMGSISISQDELEQMLRSLPPSARQQLKGDHAAVERWLADRLASEALLREAQSKKWADQPQVKSQIDAAVREITGRSYLASVSQPPADYPSDADLRAAYEQNKGNFNVPAVYHVAQIYLAAPQSDSNAVAKARTQAQALAAQARSGDFAALAQSQSQDRNSAANGGDVGTLPLEQLLPEVRTAVSTMKPGQVSDPVQSPTGFHIVKLIDSKPAHTATFDEVKPRLQQLLRQQRQQQLAQAYLQGLAKQGSYTIDNAAVDAALSKGN
ncbi:peptidylprolyl isomerase [Pigmentiphaga soli]|uniref:Peptidylprolyl isomerase n=1 Tax=Pigmentiphaga soli TaxID=1007095 RepID=A0ABP8HJM4_9BURK